MWTELLTKIIEWGIEKNTLLVCDVVIVVQALMVTSIGRGLLKYYGHNIVNFWLAGCVFFWIFIYRIFSPNVIVCGNSKSRSSCQLSYV